MRFSRRHRRADDPWEDSDRVDARALGEIPEPDLPAAIVERLIQFHGVPEGPPAGSAAGVLDREPFPYQAVVARLLSQGWEVIDTTDSEYSNSRELLLERDGFHINVQLSLVGPYAHISSGRLENLGQAGLSRRGDSPEPHTDQIRDLLRDLLMAEGFAFLDEQTLARRVSLWTDPAEPDLLLMMGGTCASLYGYLFSANPDIYEPEECAADRRPGCL